MTRPSNHRVQLGVYVTLVFVLFVALAGYTHHIHGQLADADHVSCANRKVLLRNQRLVIRYLHSHIPRSRIDPETGRPWWVEFAERIPSTDPPQCK